MKKKTKVILISIFLIIVSIITINILDSKKEYFVKKTELKYTLPVTYVIADKNTTPKNITTDELYGKYSDSYIMPVISYESIKKDKNGNYTAKINNVNEVLIDSLTSYGFGLNDNNGNVINDVKYDEKTRTITIPAHYYEEEPEKSPIRMEILSLMTLEELKNVKTDVTVNKIFDYNKTSITTALDVETNISIGNYKELKKLTKEDIDVYLNDGTMKLSNDDLSFDPTSGVITIPKNTLSIKNIDVDIKDTIVDKAKGLIKTAYAAKCVECIVYPEDEYTSPNIYQIPKPDTLPLAGSISNTNRVTTFYFDDERDTIKQTVPEYPEIELYTWEKLEANYPRVNRVKKNFNKENNSMVGWEGFDEEKPPLLFPFIVNIQGTWTFHKDGYQDVSIEFPAQEKEGNYDRGIWVRLFCVNYHDGSDPELVETPGDGYPIFMKVLAADDSSITISIRGTEEISTQQGGAVYKLKWGEDKGKIVVQKKLKDGDNEENANKDHIFDINLYEGQGCKGTKVGKVSTNEYGQAVFNDLKLGEYSINETFTDTQNWRPLEECKNVILDTTDKDPNDKKYYIENVDYTNIKKKYCASVKKVDAGNAGCNLNGITFALKNSTKTKIGEATTGTNGRVTFKDLDYGSYYYSETSTDKTLSSSSCGGEYQYYNDDPSDKDLKLTSMTGYDKETGKYTICDASENDNVRSDNKVYYCMKVKKVDKATGEPLAGAKFKIEGTDIEKTTDTYGIATFMLGPITNPNYNVIETQAPEGYELPSNTVMQVVATAMPKGITSKQSIIESNCNAEVTESVTYKDSKLLINWYKVTENATTRANGAVFKVKNSNGQYIKVSSPENQKDASGKEKQCYRYNGVGNDGVTITSMDTKTNGGSTNGETCISGLPKGDYTVEEVTPAQYHTFGKNKTISLTTKTIFDDINDSNKYINYPTYFEFTKTATETQLQEGNEKYYNQTTKELKQIEFNVIDSSGNIVSFIERTDSNGNKIYSYSKNNIDKPVGTEVSALHIDDLRKIRIEHLPWGEYSIKEKNTNTCENGSSYGNCVGYYYPNYDNESDYKFTIGECSNEQSTSCSSKAVAIQSLNNEPTEIGFTKKDFYNYEDASDIVDFENDKERNDFDRIDFKIRDSEGNYLTLTEVGSHGNCLTDDSYREYRYISDSEQIEGGTTLHTCGGHIKITNLCRGKQYIVEEVSVPSDSVFVKQVDQNGNNPSVNYTIPCIKGKTEQQSTTQIINDKGTRVRFEKRDSKYNYLIPDETTTFEVYRCKKGIECHPTDNRDENGKIMESDDYKLIKFSSRSVIVNDEEDTVDAEGLAGVEVYKAMSDSDVQNGNDFVTSLHPYKGILVLRYLQSGYDYVLVETVAPKNYKLPVGRNVETKFTVTNETVDVEEVDVPNKPTSILIKKYSNEGNLLTGAQFKIYEGTTCDSNLSPMNQPKKELNLKTIRDGVYENRPQQDTSVITTCTDKEDSKCSNIPVNEVTKLTYTDYLGTWAEYGNEQANDKEQVELKEGEALIQYLEYGHCYIIEEVKAPEGYSLSKNKEDRFTMVTIDKNDSYEHTTEKTLVNAPTPFTFYKYDEFNNLLDGAEFKLQKLDNNKKYQDITVSEEVKDGKLFYKVDSSTKNITIKTKEGSATVYYLSSGQYRIIETKPAIGKELTKNPNIATFFVDEQGNVFGNSIIANKGKTEKIKIVASAKSELIVAISTGQTVIKYGLIIAILLAIIIGLIILKKKTK